MFDVFDNVSTETLAQLTWIVLPVITISCVLNTFCKKMAVRLIAGPICVLFNALFAFVLVTQEDRLLTSGLTHGKWLSALTLCSVNGVVALLFLLMEPRSMKIRRSQKPTYRHSYD